MCYDCLLETVLPADEYKQWAEDGTFGSEPRVAELIGPFTPEMNEAVTLVRQWYDEGPDGLGFGTGGPLHPQLDDMNLEDDLLSIDLRDDFSLNGGYDIWEAYGDQRTPRAERVGNRICELLVGMDLPKRLAVVYQAWSRGHIAFENAV